MPSERPTAPSGGELAGLAVFLAAAVLVPLVAGLGIDAAAHTSPLGMLVGVALGAVAAACGLWLRLRRYL